MCKSREPQFWGLAESMIKAKDNKLWQGKVVFLHQQGDFGTSWHSVQRVF